MCMLHAVRCMLHARCCMPHVLWRCMSSCASCMARAFHDACRVLHATPFHARVVGVPHHACCMPYVARCITRRYARNTELLRAYLALVRLEIDTPSLAPLVRQQPRCSCLMGASRCTDGRPRLIQVRVLSSLSGSHPPLSDPARWPIAQLQPRPSCVVQRGQRTVRGSARMRVCVHTRGCSAACAHMRACSTACARARTCAGAVSRGGHRHRRAAATLPAGVAALRTCEPLVARAQPSAEWPAQPASARAR